ncbi:uncharacterized protein [Branchiostoma lanceolatum]|uniref:uncharacterized protein n=1 Tax=Branchiostoma lanceolatum TaxID=7740 RepID=UPI003456D107
MRSERDQSRSDGFHDYTCNCTVGFEGRYCEINPNDCVPDPCPKNYTCIDQVNGYVCHCEPGWPCNGLTLGEIVGITVGCLVALIILFVIFKLWTKNRGEARKVGDSPAGSQVELRQLAKPDRLVLPALENPAADYETMNVAGGRTNFRKVKKVWIEEVEEVQFRQVDLQEAPHRMMGRPPLLLPVATGKPPPLQELEEAPSRKIGRPRLLPPIATGKGKSMGLNPTNITGTFSPGDTGPAGPPVSAEPPGLSGENGSMEPAGPMGTRAEVPQTPGVKGPMGPMRQTGPFELDGKDRVSGLPGPLGGKGPIGPMGLARPMEQVEPIGPSCKDGVLEPVGSPGKMGSVESAAVEPPGLPINSPDLTGPHERPQISVRGKPSPTYSTNDVVSDWSAAILRTEYTGNNPGSGIDSSSVPQDEMSSSPTYSKNDGNPDWSKAILRTEDLSVLYTGNEQASGIDSPTVPLNEIPNSPTYSKNDGDPDWSVAILRTEELSVLYTENNPASGNGSSSVPQDEILSSDTVKDMETEQETQVRPQNNTLDARAKRSSDAYEQHVDDIEPYAVTYTCGDETNRGETSPAVPETLQSTITDPDISEDHLAGSPGSTFVGNCTSDGTRDTTGDNGPGIPRNRRESNADVRKLRNSPDDLCLNPMYATSGGHKAINGSCSIGRCFCLIATVVFVASGATIAAILIVMFRNAQEHDIQKTNPTQDSRNWIWTTSNITEPAVIATTVSTNPSILHITDGYAVFRGIFYKVFKTQESFGEASATCHADGGTLAMPRDAQINDFLISLFR